ADEVHRLILRAVAGLHHRRRVQPVQRHVAGVGDVQLPELHRRPHVNQVDLAGLAQFVKLLRADGRDGHGDLLSSWESGPAGPPTGVEFIRSAALVGAELGPQAPLSQVLTPKRGSTHAWRMTQATRTPNGMRNSIVFAPFIVSPGRIPAPCLLDRSRHYDIYGQTN